MPAFPVVVVIDGSSRHEVLFLSPDEKLPVLKQQIMALREGSPNCRELLSKYNVPEGEEVTELKVRWAQQGRDPKIFPGSTIITDANCEAVFTMMQAGVGRDVLEVRIGQSKPEE